MKESVEMGMNRTGIQMSPSMSKEMSEMLNEFPMPQFTGGTSAGDMRQMYIQESGSLGAVPLPGNVKGAMSIGMQKITDKNPEVFVDKLGERLAFERTGVRLYDALITRCEVAMPQMDLSVLKEFRNEEHRHFLMLKETIESIGGDPTAVTPCADSAAVASMGLIQVLNDPKSSVPQAVQAILIAELADNDGWDILISLARNAGMTEEASRFEAAKVAEEKHLAHIRQWLERLVMNNEVVSIQ